MTVDLEQIRARYAEAARGVNDVTGCCGPMDDGTGGASDEVFGGALYPAAALEELPVTLAGISLGCGVPTEVAALHPGEVVLDLGSGGGLDVLLSAQRVGPEGHAYGLDMTEEMLELARRHQAEAGIDNATFLHGRMEDIPLQDGTVDVVISNCVVNLSLDKAAVFDQLARVVRAGGRLAISDVVADDHLSPAERAARGSYVGCIAGALSEEELTRGLTGVGFVGVSVERTHQVTDGMHAGVIRAVRSETP